MIRAAVLLALPAFAAAKLNECPESLGLFTGVDPASLSGTPLNPVSPVFLKYDCDLMQSSLHYSESGIPCGSINTPTCDPGPNISFPNANYPRSALDAVADAVEARLMTGANNADAGSLLDVAELELAIEVPTKLNVTFLDDGACDRNSFGFTRFRQDAVSNGDPRDMTFVERRDLIRDVLDFTVIFPNVDFEFCRCGSDETPASFDPFCTETSPFLTRGTTMKIVEDFRSDPSDIEFDPGYFVSFFLLDDGFDNGFHPGGDWVDRVENIIFTTPELNDPDMIRRVPGFEDLRQHAFVFKGFSEVEDPTNGAIYDFSDEIFVCFEDRRRFRDGPGRATDNDFEDLCVFISSHPPLRGFEPSAAPTTPDSAMPSTTPSFSVCDAGILSECGNVCCGADCGSCGGCDCAGKAGGASLCCPQTILFAGIECMAATDVGCIVDDSLVCAAPGSGCDRA